MWSNSIGNWCFDWLGIGVFVEDVYQSLNMDQGEKVEAILLAECLASTWALRTGSLEYLRASEVARCA